MTAQRVTKQTDGLSNKGTFAVPAYYIPDGDLAYAESYRIFKNIKWAKPPKRADAIKNRFNAFSALLWAVTEDPDWITHTDLNKASYNIRKWPIPYDAMKDTVNALKDMGWLVQVGERKQNRQYRYMAASRKPMRKMKPFKVKELQHTKLLVEIRLGNTDLDKAPLDVELMASPKMKKTLSKYLIPTMDNLNDKLADHTFELFPFGRSDEWVQPIYKRIYTNAPTQEGLKQSISHQRLTHGRIYPLDYKTFQIPSKKKGWRQQTRIDDEPTTEVDVHASSLRLLSEDYYIGFDLPETEDLYSYGKLSNLNRDLTKKVIQAVINGVTLDYPSWPKSFMTDSDALIDGQDWNTYTKAIAETYPNLSQVRKDHGLNLMMIESNIIIYAMNYLLDKEIGCLSIHDCLIVPEQHTEDAVIAFNEAYKYQGLKQPKLSIGW